MHIAEYGKKNNENLLSCREVTYDNESFLTYIA